MIGLMLHLVRLLLAVPLLEKTALFGTMQLSVRIATKFLLVTAPTFKTAAFFTWTVTFR